MAILLMVLAAVVTAVSQLLLKISSKKKYKTFLASYLNVFVIVGYALLFSATMLNTTAYRTVEYKYGLAISFLSYALVMILSSLYFKEKIRKSQLIGITSIIAGIIIFNL